MPAIKTKSLSALIICGHGLNCEQETKLCFKRAKIKAKIIHIDDLIANKRILNDVQILAFPGGFSYGDHTGAGQALAMRLSLNLAEELNNFFAKDTLTIGICNGAQALIKSKLIWKDKLGKANITLALNQSGKYICSWAYVKIINSKSPWLNDKDKILHLPIAHKEGRFIFINGAQKHIALKYVKAPGNIQNNPQSFNPNGSYFDCAGITNNNGRILAMMPHCERAYLTEQSPVWTLSRETCLREQKQLVKEYDGSIIFKNALKYFS